MEFGTPKKDAPERGAGKYLRRFKPGENRVRFLEDTDDWLEFWEHRIGRNAFPCTGDKQTCPGCTHEDEKVYKASQRYGTYVYLPQNKAVLPFAVPRTVCDKMEIRAARNDGTITSRDYVIIRTGEGIGTEYDVDNEEKYDLDLKALLKEGREKLTVQECLQESWNEVWGNNGEGAATATRIAATEDREKAQNDDPPSDAAAQNDSGTPPDTTLTEAEVRAMEKPALRDLCKRAEVAYDDDDTKTELIEKLFAKVA